MKTARRVVVVAINRKAGDSSWHFVVVAVHRVVGRLKGVGPLGPVAHVLSVLDTGSDEV